MRGELRATGSGRWRATARFTHSVRVEGVRLWGQGAGWEQRTKKKKLMSVTLDVSQLRG